MERGLRPAALVLTLGATLLAADSTAHVSALSGAGRLKPLAASAPPSQADQVAQAVADNAPLPILMGAAPVEPPRTRLIEGPVEDVLYGPPDSDPSRKTAVAQALKLFVHRLDVTRDIALGDRVRLIVSRASDGGAELDYAELDGASARVRLYRDAANDRRRASFVDETGVPLDRFLLRTPLRVVRITSGFGPRLHPLLGYGRMHRGVDFGAAIGTPVLAAGDGVVAATGWSGGYGRRIVLRHPDGAETLYGHLSREAPALLPGGRVAQGQVIGWTGATGQATGPHLHFEVRLRGVAVDPAVARPVAPVMDARRRRAFEVRRQAIDRLLADCRAAGTEPCSLS